MSTPEMVQLRKHLSDISSLRAAVSLMHWDQSTLMPDHGAEFRGGHLASVERIQHEKSTSPELGRLLAALAKAPLESETEKALVRVALEDYERAVRLPPSYVEEMAAHSTVSYHLWKKARAARDFKSMVETLKKTVDLSQRYSSYFTGFNHIADPLIDSSDPGSTVAELRPLFAELSRQLVPLAARILERGPFDNSCLRQEFDENKQLEFGVRVIEKLGYDFKRGRQDKTAHPFMIRLNTGDVRITTRVKENDLGEALFSTIHEAGHALYELGIDAALEGTPLASGTSFGVHESQSRLWENIVGRSLPFWRHFYPQLQAVFPSQLGNVSLATFHRAINRVDRSLIRTDADEVTYNLHVMIRFDLETELLEGRLKVEDLKDAWNARYRSDLGVTPPHDGDGALQDVHWFSGLIGGAFQGYTLGNVMSAQFFESARAALPDLDNQMARGEFSPLRDWLRTNLHHHGRIHKGPEAVRVATGRPLEIAPYMRYLTGKYDALLNDRGSPNFAGETATAP